MSLTDAPIFCPTVEEFRDPLQYIDHICSSLKDGAGICVIQPPPSWQPPFVLDVNSFRFNACVQNISGCREENEAMEYTPSREYSLETFQNMADIFKSNYFRQQPRSVSSASVERQFWNMFSSNNDSICVRSAMNIRGVSGFPNKVVIPEDEEYVKSGWNLRNLADTNLLSYSKDAAARNDTECNVEMCFSFAPWTSEDHWTYRVSYVHWGDAVTWYATPSGDHERMRDMLDHAAESKKNDGSDCLEQFLLSVSQVLKSNVSVAKAVQSARQFVVTLPRTFHAHVSHGFNFSESLRFCTPSWLPVGMWFSADSCVRRTPLSISYEELVCRLLHESDSLDMTTLGQVYRAARKMLSEEAKARNLLVVNNDKFIETDDASTDIKKYISEMKGTPLDIKEPQVEINSALSRKEELQIKGVEVEFVAVKEEESSESDEAAESEDVVLKDTQGNGKEGLKMRDFCVQQEIVERCMFKVETVTFELMPTNERRCEVCQAICFLSALTCSCNNKHVCLRDAETSCTCPPSRRTLHQRYTLQELFALIDGFKSQVHSYEKWTEDVRAALEQPGKRVNLVALKLFILEAQRSFYTHTDLFKCLLDTAHKAVQYSSTAKEILDHADCFVPGGQRSVKEGEDDNMDIEPNNDTRLHFNELREFVAVMMSVPCDLPEAQDVSDLLATAVEVKIDAERLLSTVWPSSVPLTAAVRLFNPHSCSMLPVDLISGKRVKKLMATSSDFPGYPLRYPKPSFHYPRVPGLPAENEI